MVNLGLTDDPPVDAPSPASTVVSARMTLSHNVGGGAERSLIVDLPADEVVGPQSAAAALLPLYEALNCTFISLEITERSRTGEDPRIS